MIDGQTYYAVVSSNQFQPQTVALGLAATSLAATSSTPTLIQMQPCLEFVTATDNTMTGAGASLTEESSGSHSGVEIEAGLVSKDWGTTMVDIGLFPMMAYVLHPSGNWDVRNHGGGGHGGQQFQGIVAEEGHIKHLIPAGKDVPNEFEACAAPALVFVQNQVQAVVGGNAVVNSTGEASVTSMLDEILHSESSASIAKSRTGANDKAVAIAFNGAFVDNNSSAVIASNAQVSAEDVTVKSDIVYPFIIRETNISQMIHGDTQTNFANVASTIESFLGNALFSAAGGISNWLFNNTANTAIITADDGDRHGQNKIEDPLLSWTISCSISVIDINNNNLAQIADGAQINQNPAVASYGDNQENQSVTVEAQTSVVQTGVTGMVYPGLSLTWLLYGIKTDAIRSSVMDGTSSGLTMGGSFNYMTLQNSTQALLGGSYAFTAPTGGAGIQSLAAYSGTPFPSTNVNYGNGGLTVEAIDEVTNVILSQAGGKNTGFGFEGSFAVLNMGEQGSSKKKQTTLAQLISTNLPLVISANHGTTGPLLVEATDNSNLWALAGAVLYGGPKAVGFSGAQIELTRDISASAGTSGSAATPTQASTFNTGGTVEVMAAASGSINPVSLVGEYAPNGKSIANAAAPGGANVASAAQSHAASDIHGKWGWAVSGDYSAALVNDGVNAWINDKGTFTGQAGAGNPLVVEAKNTTIAHATSGSAAIVNAHGNTGPTVGLSGSASVVVYDAAVNALLSNAILQNYQLELIADNAKKVGSFSGGMQVSAVTGSDLSVAGSVAFNQITNNTQATLNHVTAEDLEEASVAATSADQVWAAAGMLTITWAKRDADPANPEKPRTVIGVGVSGAMNTLINTTHSTVENCEITNLEGAMGVSAEDFSHSFVFSAGVNVTVPAGTSVELGGMWSTTNIAPDTQALVTGSNITGATGSQPTNLDVIATFIPVAISFAGYVAVEANKIFTVKENKVGVGVGAGVVVTNIQKNGSNLAQTVASIADSEINLPHGEITVDGYSGNLSSAPAGTVSPLSELPDPDGNNIWSLAIAGSAQGESAGDNAVGTAVAGALIFTNLGLATSATIEGGSPNAASAEQITVAAKNALLVYTDAGGVTLAGQMSVGNGVGVAIGGAYNSFSSNDTVSADITDATVTTQSLEVASVLAPNVHSIVFGVAVDVAAAGGTGCAVSLSGAFAYQNVTDSALSFITGGTTTVNGAASGDTLTVSSADRSTYQESVGAGSLAVAVGGEAAVALAPSAAVGKMTIQNQVDAYVGSQSAASATPTAVAASVPVVVQATVAQAVTATVVAVAASVAASENGVALSGGGASASITTANKVDSGLLYGTTLNSTWLPTPAVQGQPTDGLTLSAIEKSNLAASVGSGALAVGVIGASLGISLAEITTSDQVGAVIRSAAVNTAGAGVSVQATGQSSLATMSVPTALAVAIGLAGAGGNSNITDSSKYLASIDTSSTVTTGSASVPYGDLAVVSQSQDTLLAQIFGGAAGLGSIGAFFSDTVFNGSSTAQISNAGFIAIGDLTVQATGNHAITSDGYSVTIGGLAGTGETHQLTYSETIATTINKTGSTPGQIMASGNAIINAQCNTTAIARDSGQNPSQAQTSYTISGLGVGVYQAKSTFTPVLTTTVTNVNMQVGNNLSVSTTVSGSNTAQAMAGSGALISGEASTAQTTNSPSAKLTLGSDTFNAGNISLQAVTNMTYDAYADSVNVNLAGGGGTKVTNTSNPAAQVNLGGGTTLTSTGQIDIASNNIFQRGIQSNEVDGLMVRVGAGGVLTGYGGSITTTFSPISTVTIADGNVIKSTGSADYAPTRTSSGISILATQTASMQEDANLATGGLLVSLDWNNTSQSGTVTTNVAIGNNVTLVASAGSINIGTLVNINAETSASTTTWGLGGNATSSATSTWTVNQSVTAGNSTQIFGLGNVSIVAGENPMNGQVSAVNTLTLAYARTRGLVDIPIASTDNCSTKSTSTLSIGLSSTTQSAGSVNLGANPGNNTATAYWRTQYDANHIKYATSNALANSSSAAVNGTVQAGVDYLLNIELNAAGNALTINGGAPINLNPKTTFASQAVTPNSVTPVTPGATFFPFQASYNTSYTPSASGVNDPATAALLQTSVSSTAVSAIQLSGLVAEGGNIVVKAGALSGNASLYAYTPSINITNPSADYLILNGVSIVGGDNSGNISLLKVGGGILPQGNITSFPNANKQSTPTIVVNQTYPSAVGTGTTSGPAAILEGSFTNPSGNVSITNAMGAIIEIAPIKAVSVTISSPNSAFVLSTPSSYYGVGGNILDAFGKTQQPTNGNPTGTTAYTPNWTIPGYAFQPGKTTTGWNANLAATAAVDYIYNGVSSANGPGMKQLNSSAYQNMDSLGFNQLYNGSTYQIVFGNSAPYQGNGADTQSLQETASSLGSGGILAASYPNYFGVGSNTSTQGNLPVVLPDQTIYAEGLDSAVSPYLTGGLTAAQVSITAYYIDINAPLNVGISTNININFTAALGTTLNQFQKNYQNGGGTPSYQIPASYLGGDNADFTATYNAQTNQITLSPIATTSAQVGALLAGRIISTTSWGNINMTGGPGLASINNGTGIPLVLGGINSGSAQVSGTIEIQDSLSGNNTKYVYNPNQGLTTYTAPQGQPYPSTGVHSSSPQATYNPVAGALLTQSSSASIWRGLNVGGDVWTNFDNSSNGGFWNFGPQVSNSNFSQGVTSQSNLNPKTYVYPTSAQSSTYGGWQFNNPATIEGGSNNAGIATTGSAFSPATPPDADNACAFIQNQGFITQSVYLTPGSYSVSFQAAYRSGYANDPIQVSIGGTKLGGTITANSTSFTTYTTSTSFEVTTAGYYTLQLTGTSTGNGSTASTQGNVFIDDVLLYWSPTASAPSPYVSSSRPQVQLQQGNSYGALTTSSYTLPSGCQFVEYLVAKETTNGYFTASFASEKHGDYANGMSYGTINYDYPSGYTLQLNSYAKADNPIGINFGAMQAGSLSINSDAAVILGGGVLFAGNVDINSTGLSQVSSDGITASEIQLNANQGSIGSEHSPITVNPSGANSVSAFGEGGVFMNSPGNLNLNNVSTAPLAISGFMGGSSQWSTVNGVSPIVGFSGFQTQGVAVIGSNSSSLQLTNGTGNEAASAWSPSKVSTGSFTAQFTYTPSGNKQADGISFAFQNQGSNALGNTGGSLGYTGITGQTVAYQLNLYNGHQIGSNFITNNYTGTYQPTGSVQVNSGHPIQVTLVYDEISQTVTETLLDSVTSATFTRTYGNVRLGALLGPTAYVGFTGADGGDSSIQTITNFQFQPNLPQFSGNTMLAIPTGVNNQLSAAWCNTPVNLASSFGASFVYQALGRNPADGTALVFQNAGLNALGGAGGLLGYANIGNNQNTAAYEINIYNGHTIGTNFVTNGQWGTYNPTGSINMASGHQILVNLDYDQPTGTMYENLVDLTTGSTFSTKYSINLQNALNAKSCFIGFTSADGGAFASQTISDFRFGYKSSANGNVAISAAGNITSANSGSYIQGSNVSLVSNSGSIGTSSQAIALALNPQSLTNGSIVGGVFSASAANNLYVSAAHGDLRVGSVVAGGSVNLTAVNGDIVDGISPDGSGLNSGAMTQANLAKITGILDKNIAGSSARDVDAYEGMIDRNYQQYWSLAADGSVQNGVFVVSANGYAALEPQVAMAYGTPSVTNAQVQSWANGTWQQCVASFQSTLAFGPSWQTLPQFLNYDANYVFIAPQATVDQLTAGSTSAFGLIAGISETALQRQGSGDHSTSNPNIKAGSLVLTAMKGSVGLSKSPVIIPLADIDKQTLTPSQKEILTLASQAGEVMMVGKNSSGGTQTYHYGSPPAGVVPTGVQVTISRPLLVDVAPGGTATIKAQNNVLVTETNGSLNINSISAKGTVRLAADGSILSAPSNAQPAITCDDLILISNAQIGSGSTDPLLIQAGGRVDANSKGDLSLNQVSGDLKLGQLISGGTISLQCAQNIIDGQTGSRQSVDGFQENGSGWTSNSVNGNISVVDNLLTFTNATAPSTAGSPWPSINGFVNNQAIGLDQDFSVNYLYQSTGSNGGLAFTLFNPNLTTTSSNPAGIGQKGSLSFVLNLGDGTANSQSAGFDFARSSGPSYVPQSTGQVIPGSGDPIQVYLHYSYARQAWTCVLTDTVTGMTTMLDQTGLDLPQMLGTDKVQMAFSSFGSGSMAISQSVSGFNLTDSAANLQGSSLAATASGSFGSESNPITMLILGEVTITAPNGIYAEQLAGNLNIGQITSSDGVVSLSVPNGNVEQYVPPAPMASSATVSGGVSTLSFTPYSFSEGPSVSARQLRIDALLGIGTNANPLQTVTRQISGRSRLGDVTVDNSGDLAVGSPSQDEALLAGGAISVSTTGTLDLFSTIKAGTGVALNANASTGGPAKVVLHPGSNLSSALGSISVFGNDGIEAQQGSVISKKAVDPTSQVHLSTGVAAGTDNGPITTSLLGTILSSSLVIQGGSTDQGLHFAVGGLKGFNNSQLSSEVSGFGSIHADDSLFADGRSFVLGQNMLKTSNMNMVFSSASSLLLDMGSGNDRIDIGTNTGLSDLTVHGNGGDDSFFVILGDKLLSQMSIDGGDGNDHAVVNTLSQNAWAAKGVIQTWSNRINHSAIENIQISGSGPVNGLPYPVKAVDPSQFAGQTTSRQFVETVFAQVLDRQPSASELDLLSRQLDAFSVSRFDIANAIGTSTEAKSLLVDAWYRNYLGRPASPAETAPWVRLLTANHSETEVLSWILASPEFASRVGIIEHGTDPAVDYITGLYRLAIDPSGQPAPALLANLLEILKTEGKAAVASAILGSGQFLANQAESLNIQINYQAANDQLVADRHMFRSSTEMRISLLARQPFNLAAGSTVASLGNGQIGIWSATGDYQQFHPFPGYNGTLNVSTVNRTGGTNADSIIVAVAGHSEPHVLVIDAATGGVVLSFYAFDPGFLGGVTVAGGVTRMGGKTTSVLLCGAGSGAAPAVSVFDAVSGASKGAFYAFDRAFTGGVRVALSAPDANGASLVWVASAINSHVVAFNLDNFNTAVSSFYAFANTSVPNGVYLAASLDHVVVGASQGAISPQVSIFDFNGKFTKAFNPFDPAYAGGVRTALADYNRDGKLDIVVASSLGAPGTVNVFNYQDLSLIDAFFISDSMLGTDVANNFSGMGKVSW